MQNAIMRKYRFLLRTIAYVGWSLFWLLIWDIVVTVDFMLFLERKLTLPPLPLTLLGSALVVLTSFRNSSAYNRWWEARTLWGALVNNSRSFARQVLTLVEDSELLNPVKAVLLRRHVAFVKCLSAHLKKQECAPDVIALIGEQAFARRHDTNNFPNDLLNGSAALLSREFKLGAWTVFAWRDWSRRWWKFPTAKAAWSVSPIHRCHTPMCPFLGYLLRCFASSCPLAWSKTSVGSPRWLRLWWASCCWPSRKSVLTCKAPSWPANTKSR